MVANNSKHIFYSMMLLLASFFMLATMSFNLGIFHTRSLMQCNSKNAFSSKTNSRGSSLSMIFGPPKDDGKPGDYVCMDCGYIFTKGPAEWAKLPDNWRCPPCGSLKRRFKKVPKGSASGK
mmetsp:Transcript_14526/g.20775  ORF Transcript_14526/g.20775 Transcript_14526/m.20775 type:complete len:121 (+) Transcript_14526:104-466(+)